MRSIIRLGKSRISIMRSILRLGKPRITIMVSLVTLLVAFLARAENLAENLVVDSVASSAASSVADSVADKWFFPLLVGVVLLSWGINALNQYMEREWDALMVRTKHRPLPKGDVRPRIALMVGTVAMLGGLACLASINWLTGAIGVAVAVLYLGLYTPLKRYHPINMLVGAIPGAMPPLLGWAAVSNSFVATSNGFVATSNGFVANSNDFVATSNDFVANSNGFVANSNGFVASFVAVSNGFATLPLCLFVWMFLWQYAHFLPIAWLYKDQYRQAGFKMLSSNDKNYRQIRWQLPCYTLATVLVGLHPKLIEVGGSLYFLVALLLGLVFFFSAIIVTWQLSDKTTRWALRASIIYLPLLLIALAIGGW